MSDASLKPKIKKARSLRVTPFLRSTNFRGGTGGRRRSIAFLLVALGMRGS